MTIPVANTQLKPEPNDFCFQWTVLKIWAAIANGGYEVEFGVVSVIIDHFNQTNRFPNTTTTAEAMENLRKFTQDFLNSGHL